MIAVSEIARQQARDTVDDFLFWLAQKRKRQAQPKPTKRRRRRRQPGESLNLILSWLKENQPATVDSMCAAVGMSRESVEIAIRRNKERFEVAGTVKRQGSGSPPRLWKVVG